MAKQNKKYEIYQLLIVERFSASKIARYLEVSRQYVSKTIKEFFSKEIIQEDILTKGIILGTVPKGYIKFYSATHKSFESAYGRMSTKPSRRMSTKPEPSPKYIVQKARYEIKIEREYKDFFKNKQHWMRGNCPYWQYKVKIFDNFKEFSFVKVGKNTIIVVIPEMIVEKGRLDSAKHTLFHIAYEALQWFAKKANIRFKWDTMYCCQKPHITRPAKDSKAVLVTENYSLKIDGKMLDRSSGKADWETTVFDEDLIDVVDALETWEYIPEIQGQMGQLDKRLSDVEEFLPKLTNKLDTAIKALTDVRTMVTPKAKPADKNDPSYN